MPFALYGFLSRTYLSSGRVFGMVVVRLSVCRPSDCHGYIVAKRCEIGSRLL